MSQIIDFIFKFEVPKDKQERYEQILAEQIKLTQDEKSTLIYNIFRNADGLYCQHERYASEEACMAHCNLTAALLAEWMETVNMIEITALGELSKDFLQQFGIESSFLQYKAAK